MSSEKKTPKLISFLSRSKSSAARVDKTSEEPTKDVEEGANLLATSPSNTAAPPPASSHGHKKRGKSKERMTHQDQSAAAQAPAGQPLWRRVLGALRPRWPQVNMSGCTPRVTCFADLLIQIIIGAVIGGSGWLVWNGHISFSGSVSPDDLWDFKSQIRYCLRWQVLPLTWLLWTVLHVWCLRRRLSRPGATKEMAQALHMAQDRQQSALLELVLTSQTQFVLMTWLEPRCVIMAVPVINILFFVGQLARLSAIRHIQWHARWAMCAPVIVGVLVSNVHLIVQLLGIPLPFQL